MDRARQLTNRPRVGEGYTQSSESRNQLVATLRQNGYTIREFLISPTQMNVPNSRLRYYLLVRFSIRSSHLPNTCRWNGRLTRSVRPAPPPPTHLHNPTQPNPTQPTQPNPTPNPTHTATHTLSLSRSFFAGETAAAVL